MEVDLLIGFVLFLEKGQFDVKQVLLSFQDCFELLDFWLSTDKEVIVLTDKEFEQKQSLRTDTIRIPKVLPFEPPKNLAQKKENGILRESNHGGTHKESVTHREYTSQKESNGSHESEIMRTLRESMKSCELAISVCQNEEEKRMLANAIQTLKKKISLLQNEPRTVQRTVVIEETSPMERRMRGLSEIYQFYAKQHLRYGIYARFDTCRREKQIMNFGEFVFVIKDFNLLKDKSDKPQVQEIFKYCSSNGKELEFFEFQVIYKLITE